MIKDELQIKVNECFEHAEKVLSERGELMPMLDIEFTNAQGGKELMAIGLAIGDERKKRDAFITGLGLLMAVAKQLGKIQEVKCIVMMSEAWFSTPSKSEYKLMHGKIRMPSEDPNRREMLMAYGLTADGIIVIKSKEMLTVEVKGKKHFTLIDMPTMKEYVSAESNVLARFFKGYEKGMEDNERNRTLLSASFLFKDIPLDELLNRSIKVLTQQVGGLASEIIKHKE